MASCCMKNVGFIEVNQFLLKVIFRFAAFLKINSIMEIPGKDQPKTAATISAVGNDCIFVKKQNGEKLRFFLASLARGKISIKRRAS